MYSFREVICPKCNHLFIHQNHSINYNKSSWYEYYDMESDTFLDYTVCPMCAYGMVLYEKHAKGADPDDERIKKYFVHGI